MNGMTTTHEGSGNSTGSTTGAKMAEAAEAARRFADALAAAGGTAARKIEQASRRAAISRAATKGLADFLIARDWPNATPREISVRHGRPYGRMAAAIIAGEAWAIRQAWPEAAYDIRTRSDWSA